MTIEQFKASREQGTALSSESISAPLSVEVTIAEPAPNLPLEQAPREEVHPTTATDLPLAGAERGVALTGSPEPATQPAISESAIELFSEPPAAENQPRHPS
jgi:hypothetical protein